MALINAIFGCDMMVDAVGDAGERMKLTAEALEKMDHAEASWDRATIPEAKAALEEEWSKAATIVADQATYQTAAEHGQDQGVFLKALDFADEVGPDIRMYNVCTQPCSIHGKCGLAFPSKLWWQKGVGTRFGNLMSDPAMTSSKAWSYKCQCEWGYLAEEAALKPQSEAAKWHSELAKEYGGDYNQWPRIGCQQGFRAFKNGASMVMELKVGNEFQAFVSERMPETLDDAIKKRNYDKFRKYATSCRPRSSTTHCQCASR